MLGSTLLSHRLESTINVNNDNTQNNQLKKNAKIKLI